MGALIVPVAGAYSSLFGGNSFGILDDNGFELDVAFHGQEINETDAYGMTLLEAIHRGMDWRIRVVGMEWKAALLNVLQQFGFGSAGVLSPTLGSALGIGGKYSLQSQTLALTSVLGSPPTAPATLTALGASLAPSNQSRISLTSKVRLLPLELILFPYLASGIAVPFTTT